MWPPRSSSERATCAPCCETIGRPGTAEKTAKGSELTKDGTSGSSDARKQLVASLRAGHKAARGRPPARTVPKAPPAGPAAFDFSSLPQFRQLRMHRAAAEMIGLDNPFFRAHAGVAGATTVIGYITTRIDLQTQTGSIPNMAVLPEHQGKGIGLALLEFAKQELPDRIVLVTQEENVRARRFYEREGFCLHRSEYDELHRRMNCHYVWTISADP